jgi:hypothetical protein
MSMMIMMMMMMMLLSSVSVELPDVDDDVEDRAGARVWECNRA